MTNLTIYHNPRCSKSRETLALITEKNITPKVVEYLKKPLTQSAIKSLLKQLDIPAIEMVRTKERCFKELGLSKDASEAILIKAMAENPVLIERPIVTDGKTAIIGRPPENVLQLL